MHVHVGKRNTTELCKIWLEPAIEIASPGTLTIKQQNEVLAIVKTYKKEMVVARSTLVHLRHSTRAQARPVILWKN